MRWRALQQLRFQKLCTSTVALLLLRHNLDPTYRSPIFFMLTVEDFHEEVRVVGQP